MNKKAIGITSLICVAAIAISIAFVTTANTNRVNEAKAGVEDTTPNGTNETPDTQKDDTPSQNTLVIDDEPSDPSENTLVIDDEPSAPSEPSGIDDTNDLPGGSAPVNANVISLNHQILGDNLFIDSISLYLPDGWTASASSEYKVCYTAPLQSLVEVVSPAGDCGVMVLTPMSYLDAHNTLNSFDSADDESSSMLDYSTYLKYRDASEYTDYFLNKLGLNWLEYDSITPDRNQLDLLTAQLPQQAQKLQAQIQNQYISSGLSTEEITFASNYEGSIVQKVGRLSGSNGTFYAKTYCVCEMIQATTNGRIVLVTDKLPYSQGQTFWGQDGFSLYWAADEETFKKNEALAQFIIDNIGTTAMYQQVSQKMIDVMIPQVINGNQEINNYAQEIISEVQANFSGTNDRVNQMWDDYLLDQDRYQTSDGTELIVPTTAEYVYYNGNDVIWSDNASYEPEAGYVQVN